MNAKNLKLKKERLLNEKMRPLRKRLIAKCIVASLFMGILAFSILNPSTAVAKDNVAKASFGISAMLLPFVKAKPGAERIYNGGSGGGAPELTEEQKAFAKVIGEQSKALYKTLLSENFADDDLKAIKSLGELKDKIDKATSKEDFDALKKELEKVALALKKFEELPKQNEGRKSFAEEVISTLEANKESLKDLSEKKTKSVNFTVKAAGTITTSNVSAVAGGISMLLNSFEPGITPLPRTAPFFLDLFTAVPTGGSTVSYAEMKTPDGGAGMTGEGALKSQADFDLVEAKQTVRKVTAYIKTSREALDDIAALAGEINGELMTLVKLKADSQAMNGDGTGQNLTGIIYNSPAFTGGDLAGTIPFPNNFDVLAAGLTEIMTAEVIAGEPAGFMPNVIVMNPIDVVAMKLTKNTYGDYVFPITLPGSTTVLEVPIVMNARMTVGDFEIMDTTRGNYRVRGGVEITVGYENDDFTKNLVTILAEMRLCIFVKSQHTKAFLTGDFESAKALIGATI